MRGASSLRLDQRHARTVDTGNGLRRELRHVAEQIDHPAGAGHQAGHPSQPRVQVDLVGLQLCGGQLRTALVSGDRAARRSQPW